MRSSAVWSVDVPAVDRARVLHGWTQRELGRRANVDEGTLCDLFAGRRRPTFGTLHALCAALELSLESVICFLGPEPTSGPRRSTLGEATSADARPGRSGESLAIPCRRD
jgi:transcriptional regulator with XRE-family HTH domain